MNLRTKLLAIVCAVCCGMTSAEDAPAQKGEVTPFVYVSLRSASVLEQLAKKLSLPLPPAATAAGVSQIFPFLGEKGMNADKPVSVILLLGAGLKQQQQALFVLPAVDSSSFVTSVKEKGMQSVVKDADVYLINNMPFRFTKDYVLFGGTLDAVTKIDTQTVARPFSEGEVLARLVIDAKSVRAKDQAALQKFVDDAARPKPNPLNLPKNDAEAAGERFGRETVRDLMLKKLERLTVDLSSNDSGLVLALQITPSSPLKLSALPRPGLPTTCLARMDLSCAAPDFSSIVQDLFEKVLSGQKSRVLPATDDERKIVGQYFRELMMLFLEADCSSWGINDEDGKVAGYVVKQFSEEYDFAAKALSLAELGKKAAAVLGEQQIVRLEKYVADDGTKVSRLIFGEAGVDNYCLDGAQVGKRVFMTISADMGKRMKNIIGLPDDAVPAPAPVAGWVDPTALLTAMSKRPDAAINPEMAKGMIKAFANRRVRVEASSGEQGLSVNLKVPFEVLTPLLQAGGATQGAPQP